MRGVLVDVCEREGCASAADRKRQEDATSHFHFESVEQRRLQQLPRVIGSHW